MPVETAKALNNAAQKAVSIGATMSRHAQESSLGIGLADLLTPLGDDLATNLATIKTQAKNQVARVHSEAVAVQAEAATAVAQRTRRFFDRTVYFVGKTVL